MSPAEKQKLENKVVAKATLIILICLFSVIYLMNHIAIIKTDSIEEKACLIKTPDKEMDIKKGEVLFFRSPSIYGCKLIAKYAAGLPGSNVEISRQRVQIDAEAEIENLIEHEIRMKNGTVLKIRPESYLLKEDEYFVKGTHKLSLDSRYVGPIKRKQIEKIGWLCI